MLENKHDKYITFNTDYLSSTIERKTGRVAFFGIESGGRDRDKHASYNLTLPAYGIKAGTLKGKEVKSYCVDECGVTFEGEGGRARYSMNDDRTMCLDIEGADKNNIFSTRLAVKTAPPTIWTEKKPRNIKCKNPLTLYKTEYKLPLMIHFPDFGRLEITASSEDVYCIEELQFSRDFVGLDLGYLNYGYSHNRMHALHYGSSYLVFKSKNPLDKVQIRLRVMEECYPELPDEDDERFNGLKRNWLNAFALNRELFDMGDNIYFHGTGHLSMQMKSDLLQPMNGDNIQYKIIRRTFEGQIERSFKESQAHDGEVSVSYFRKEKEKGFGCAVDSTPGAVISLVGISKWNLPFAKKYLKNAIKAADFIMSRDIDGDGIFETPFPGDYMFQPSEFGQCCNWWDNIAFGHKDIYFNYLCHRALRELSELLCSLGRQNEAEKYIEQLEKFHKVFLKTFYNPETELMAGWVSKNGKMHDYAFTFAVSMGINECLIPKEMGKKMLKNLLKIMKKAGYGDLRFGIPGNARPLAQEDTIYWPCMSDWGRYENGGLSGMNGFHFLTSMYKVGLNKEADEILFAILDTYERELTHTGLMPGYCQSVDWRTKEGVRCGYNYLADNYYFLLSVYAGRYGMPHPAVVK